jgi:Flp pilus assembly protein TadD
MLRSVLADHPDLAVAHALLGTSLAMHGKGTEAIAAAVEAVRLAPDLALAHAAVSDALVALGRRWEAEMAARRALELEPTQPNRFSDLAQVILGSGRSDEALVLATQGLTFDPMHLPCLQSRAVALALLGRVEEAHQTVGAALLQAPQQASLHFCVGLALEEQGGLEAAAVEYREALRLDADFSDAQRGLRRVTAWYSRLTPDYWQSRIRQRLRRSQGSWTGWPPPER